VQEEQCVGTMGLGDCREKRCMFHYVGRVERSSIINDIDGHAMVE
jgi:hypothetical protein